MPRWDTPVDAWHTPYQFKFMLTVEMAHTGHEAWWDLLRQPSPKLREDLATDSDLPPIATSV